MTMKKTRRMSVSEIQTMLGILELYDIPIQNMKQEVYEDCYVILEEKGREYEACLERVRNLLSILEGN